MLAGKTGYDILIESGLLGRAGERLCERFAPGRVLLAAAEPVDRLFGGRVRRSLEAMGVEYGALTVHADISGGTLNALNDMTRAMAQMKLGEGDTLMVLGGAMMCDMGAFALRNSRRRARLVQVPTTLLGMADWEVDGKTAVEHRPGTNMPGSFFAPDLILIDPQAAFALSDRQFENGMGEVIKCACAADASMFRMLESLSGRSAVEARMEEVIWSSLSVKASLCGEERARMRLGHNLAYAIEMAQHHRLLMHGEAVALGMLAVSRYSECLGITAHGTSKRIEDCLNRYHLPLRTSVEREEMLGALRSFSAPQCVLLERVGWSTVRSMEPDFMERAWFGARGGEAND